MRRTKPKRAFVLIMVLVVVAILTAVVVLYLVLATTATRVSGSSMSQGISDQIARSAVDVILGDLKQEIVNPGGSAGANTTVVVGPNGYQTTISIPQLTTAGTYASMLPTRSGNPPIVGGVDPIPNLVRISNRNDPVANTPMVASRASAASCSTASLNGRSVSAKRWNEHFLIPLQTTGSSSPSATAPDCTPATAANFTVPDWVFVTNTGGPQVLNAPSSSVIGRYAYAIYDEGLLDVNVAGGPSTLTSTQTANISSLGLINLANLLDSNGNPLIPSKSADTLVGWRNYASLQSNFQTPASPNSLTGQFPNSFSLSASNGNNFFYNFGRGSSSGYLKVTPLSTTQNMSDQLFLTRQQLISLQFALQQTTGFSPSALQYLTTFSRGLESPSYVPNPSGTTTSNPYGTAALSYFPIPARPTTAQYSAGQDPATIGNGTNTASGQDADINPTFPAVRVFEALAGGRNDGSDLTLGDPLVKKKFALNRLAWLTYKGPLSDGSYNGVATSAAQVSADADLQKIAGYLHDTYGLSYPFLQQGTAANIYNYFGLSWVQDTRNDLVGGLPLGNKQFKWFYNHSNSNSAGPFKTLPAMSVCGQILRVGRPPSVTSQDPTLYVQDLGLNGTTAREPDFFELLKAGIVAGSKGKAATLEVTFNGVQQLSGQPFTPFSTLPNADDFQNKLDISLDNQIIQIGANIIEQSRLDGYTVQILYSNSPTVAIWEFSGDENLPYFYGVRTGIVQGSGSSGTNVPTFSANPPMPVPNVAPPNNAYPNITTKPPTITNTGYSVAMLFPIVWNPHDQNCLRCATDSSGNLLTDSSGNPLFPTNFRLVADSTDPDDINSSATGYETFRILFGNAYEEIVAPANSASYVKTYPTSANTPANLPFTTAYPSQLDNSTYFTLTAESTALTFSINEKASQNAQSFFREPTLLISPNVPTGSSLAQGGLTNCLNPNATGALNPPISEFPNLQSSSYMDMSSGALYTTDNANSSACLNLSPILGIYLGTYTGAYYFQNYKYHPTDTAYDLPAVPDTTTLYATPSAKGSPPSPPITYRMQYETSSSSNVWVTYDTKFASSLSAPQIALSNYNAPQTNIPNYESGTALKTGAFCVGYDPRTSRFSMPFQVTSGAMDPPPAVSTATTGGGGGDVHSWTITGTTIVPGSSWSTTGPGSFGWVNSIAARASGNSIVSNEIYTERPDIGLGFYSVFASTGNAGEDEQFPQANGWYLNGAALNAGGNLYQTFFGLLQINSPIYGSTSSPMSYPSSLTCQSVGVQNKPLSITKSGFLPSSGPTEYYADPDGVVRRAMGAYFTDASASSTTSLTTTPGIYAGLPMATASVVTSTGANLAQVQSQSRPIILHRPFRSVAELGYVFSGTPWKNLDFFTPESGDAPLLDVFCIDDSDNSNGLVAGKVNLNTRQLPVLQAILTGAYKDEEANYQGSYAPKYGNSTFPAPVPALTGPTTSTEAGLIAKALLARTQGAALGYGPLVNVGDLVGRYTGKSNAYGQPYDGFSADLNSTVLTGNPTQSTQIQRFREAPIRALAAVGQTRVWNLLIDVVAQKGVFPSSAANLDSFYVQGEQHYWVHVAIDRFTGQVIDQQVEDVQE